MHIRTRIRLRTLAGWLLVPGLVGWLGYVAQSGGRSDSVPWNPPPRDSPEEWSHERARRQASLDAYLAKNEEDFRWFKNAPVGSSGIPMIMFRLFPELFPEVWEPPEAHFAPIGLSEDILEPGRVLPLGLGYSGSKPAIETPSGPIHLQVTTVTCMACHGGRVVGPDGEIQQLIGAPSTQFTSFRTAIQRTVLHSAYTADRFRDALAAKPLGWLYGDPAMLEHEAIEREIFLSPGGAEKLLDAVKNRTLALGQRFAETLGTHTYPGVPNPPDPAGPKPGYLDALGTAFLIVVDPARSTPEELGAILPSAPAEIDNMSVWRQADRPRAQWDGSIKSPLHRNVAAEVGVVLDPAAIDVENAVRTTRLTEKLPPPPYPFEVDMEAANRGRGLYQRYCATCHAPGNDLQLTPEEVGTDPNRAKLLSPFIAAALGPVLKSACTDPVACNNPDGTPLPDDQILQATGAYTSLPLDGLWARAPYLHNGSVPTLYALMTGDRPETFYRGNISYDEEKVGFTWNVKAPGAALYDTRISGLSNTGHDTPEINGIDWSAYPQELYDLLEFLKTL